MLLVWPSLSSTHMLWLAHAGSPTSTKGDALPASRSLVAAVVAVAVPASIALGAAPASAAPRAAAAPASCSAFNQPVFQKVKPKNDASLLTASTAEAASSASFGFTGGTDAPLFEAAVRKGTGLVEVHRMYRWKVQDFDVAVGADEVKAAEAKDYVDNGTSFYASATAADCLSAVYRYTSKTRHRFAVSSAQRSELERDGWKSEGIAFYASAPAETPPGGGGDDVDPTFSFAVYPDTQQETGKDGRFIDRANWLVKNRDNLDLRFMAHTGDVVNWDTPDHDQYEVASKALKPLETAKIPYTLAIGNHDTQATGPGGGARDPKNTRKLQRDTSTFNQYFNASRFGGVSGAFEKGKVDNVYSLYEAGGKQWMVLVLELWPRQTVVDWAKREVAAHPDANVVVVTHDYIDGAGNIEQSAGYGETSPQSLYDQLISQYPNIRMVLSGHTGIVNHREDTGKYGNKIYSFLTAIHSSKSNPIRLFTIDTKADTIDTRVYAPWTNETWDAATEKITGVDWVE